MATISFSSSTTTSITVSSSHNGSTVNGYRFFKNGVGEGSGITAISPATGTVSSFNYTFSGLTASQSYNLSVTFFNGATAVASAGPTSMSTSAPPVPSALTGLSVSVSGTAPSATVSASWNPSSGATSYDWSTSAGQSGSVTSTSKSITVTSAGTFTFTVYPVNASGTGPGDSKAYTVNNPPLPAALAGLSVSVSGTAPNATVTASWSPSSGATGYNWSTSGSTNDGITSGAVTTTSKSITVTSAGTFAFTVYPFNGTGTGTGDSKAYTVLIPVPSSPVIGTRFDGGFNVSWGSVSGGNSYQLDYKPSANSTWNTITTSSTSTVLNVAQWGLDYDLRVRASINGGSTYGSYSSTTVAITNPKVPTLSGTYNGGSSTATLTVGGMSGANFDSVIVEMKRTSDDALIDSKTTAVNGGQVQFIGYNSTQIKLYYFRAYSRKDSLYGAGTVYSLGYSASVIFNRPLNFVWQYSTVVSGVSAEIDYRDWNNLATSVNDFRAYKGLAAASFTSMSSGSDFYATYFNQVRNAISAMSPPTSPPGTKLGTTSVSFPWLADDIYASDLNLIVSSLNSIL